MLEKNYNKMEGNAIEMGEIQSELKDLKQETFGYKGVGDILGLNDKYKEYFDSHLMEIKNYLKKQEHTRVYGVGLTNRIVANLKYLESSGEIKSYSQKTKIDKDHGKIEGLDMKFSDAKSMIIIANWINYLKYAYMGRCLSNKPFYIPSNTVSISIKLKDPITGKIEDSGNPENLTIGPFNLFGGIYTERIKNTNQNSPTNMEISNKIEYMTINSKVVEPKVYSAPFHTAAQIEQDLQDMGFSNKDAKKFSEYIYSHRKNIVDYLNDQTGWESN